MSFGGSSTKAMPAPKQKPLGLDEGRAATNEQARPVPYVAGKTRVGVTWLCDAFEVTATAVTQQAGKGKSTTVGYNYKASLAALVCHGPVDVIEKIYLNGDEVWSGSMLRTQRTGAEDPAIEDNVEGYDYVSIDVEGFGNLRFYWGTMQQGICDLLLLSGDHPPYKGQCYAVFDQLFFGFNQTSAPNVEFVIGRYPQVAGLNDLNPKINDDCNPVSIIGDWLTNQTFGLGWEITRLDTTALVTVGTQLATEGIGLSPFINKQSSARQLFAEICEYFGGYVQMTPEGKFKIGLIRPPTDVDALPLIDESVLLEEPELNPESWSGIKTKTWIKFTDRTRGYKENALSYRDPGTALLVTDNTPQTIERPWVTVPALAQKIVAAEGRAAALPATNGELNVRRSVTLKPGDLFRLSYAQLGISNLVMRVTSRSPGAPGSRAIGLEVALDRSYFNETYFVPADDDAIAPVDTSVHPFAYTQLIELPRGLADNGKVTIAPIAVRPTRVTTAFNIHLRRGYTVTSSNNYRAGYGAGAYYSGNYTYQGNGYIQSVVAINPVVLDESYRIQIIYLASQEAGLLAAAEAYKLILNIGVISIRSTYSEQAVVMGWESMGDYTYPGFGGYKYAKVALLRARQGTVMVNLPVSPSRVPVQFYIHQQSLITFSYDQIDTHDGFAKRGVLVEDYPADTELIDRKRGLLLNLDSAYDIPASPSLNNALQNELLIFLGNEILSVTDIGTEGTHYRVYAIRGRYDTRAEAHTAGDDLFLVPRNRLKRLTHASFYQSARCSFKLQPTVVRRSLDLAAVPETAIALTGRINEPLAPINLRAFNEWRNPTYSTGEDLPLSWGLCENGPRDLWSRWSNAAVSKSATILEFYTLDGTLKRTITVPAGLTEYTYPYDSATEPDIVGDFTAGDSIKVRATAFENGLKSRFYQELIIKFI